MTTKRFAVPYRRSGARAVEGIVLVAAADLYQSLMDASDMVNAIYTYGNFVLLDPRPVGEDEWRALVAGTRTSDPPFRGTRLRPQVIATRKRSAAK